MTARIGYLLPTREQIMEGRPETAPLLHLAAQARDHGFDSVWVGDSLTARPRHDPLTLLAAVAGRVPGLTLGTAVLLPALRNPVLLAHQVATLDQLAEGRLILGVGLAADRPNIRAEFAAAGVPFEQRIGRMLEGLRLCKALWSGQPVDWDGRWQMAGAVVAPTPARSGGPLLWIGGNLPASLVRAGRHFDGWFPIAPSAPAFAEGLRTVKRVAAEHGRDPAALSGAMYLTISLDDDAARAEDRLNRFLEAYYDVPAAQTRRRQASYCGPAEGLKPWLDAYGAAGASHLVLRFAGDHAHHLARVARLLDRGS
ncbi:MAG TPA: LLM class flavin-dependent oxidoreductase [Rhodopila sp.]|uniref:LLM class flavin-dependent oxidoreductase n=1 Tax=Rhodopila sp. TaxID=2480087 RepID=UPI002CD092AB|nr:LLM class flavin-dependent oxidoreductase [Rhodopila sp.]HVY16669.1 LLM class flavin-dependent oxidoreductase [Rhodopila sp.]